MGSKILASAKLKVRVQSNSSKSEVLEYRDGVLRVRVMAPPVEGRANKAVEELLSGWLQVPKKDIAVVRGHSSRDKTVEVAGMSSERLELIESQSRDQQRLFN